MKEGLFFVRLMMTLASLAPLFALMAIRGISIIGDRWTTGSASALIVIPNVVLALRFWRARVQKDRAQIEIESATDNREHLLVYLFAVLMPLYQATFVSNREVLANGLVILFVVYLFMHMNLHYMNFVFALFGYRVFSVTARNGRLVLLTKRTSLTKGEKIIPYRLSNTVYIDA